MKHLFVSYELAVKLKEKGFDEPCFAGYNSKDRRKNEFTYPSAQDSNTTSKPRVYKEYSSRGMKGIIKAPTHQQVIDWFRDKKINIGFVPFYDYFYFVIKNYNTGIEIESNDAVEVPYYDLTNKAIEKALKMI